VKRALTIALTTGLVLTACSSRPPVGDVTARTCSGALESCGVDVGPPATRYCLVMRGACDGIPIRPEQVGGHLFAGITVSGSGRAE